MKPQNVIAAAALAACGALSACYQAPDPAGFPGEKIAAWSVVDALPIPADGQGLVHLVLAIDPDTSRDTAISIETSAGALSLSADPTTAEARKIAVKNLDQGQIPVTLRVGLTPGITLVTADVGGYRAEASLTLSASPPARVVLGSTKTSLVADGESKFDVTTQFLAADPPAKVSLGARVRFAVCCPDGGGDPSPCAGADPLVIPAEAQLDAGQSLSVAAVTERIVADAEKTAPIPAVIVAEVVADDLGGSLCDPPREGAVRDTLSLEVRPIEP